MAYGVMKGDYGVARGGYGARRGDPGFIPAILGGISLVKKAVKVVRGIGRSVTRPSAIPPIAPIAAAAGGFAAGRKLAPPSPQAVPGMPRKRYRRMNPANPKALRRAIRRQEGFIKLARRTLKGTGWTIKRTGTKAMAPKRRR